MGHGKIKHQMPAFSDYFLKVLRMQDTSRDKWLRNVFRNSGCMGNRPIGIS